MNVRRCKQSLWSLAVVIGGLSGCAGQGSKPAAGPAVEMDSIVISGTAPKDLPTDVYDAETVLHYAVEAERAGDYAKGKRLYVRLLDEFPESKLVRSARFGRARCEESLSDCRAAIPLYAAIRAEDPDAGDPGEWVDVHFREASCRLGLGEPLEAVPLMAALLAYPAIRKTDRLEAMVGRGIANKDAGNLDAAETDFVMVFAIDRQGNQYMGEDAVTRFVVAKSAYHLGETYRLRFEQTKLEFPQALLEQRLEEKSQHLLRAQTYFLRAIRLGSLEMAAASGFRVGGLYETMHEQLMAVEAPADLSEAQQVLYMEELRKKIAILLRKAVKIYDDAVAMAKRTGLRSGWVDKASEALDRIKKMYLSDISS